MRLLIVNFLTLSPIAEQALRAQGVEQITFVEGTGHTSAPAALEELVLALAPTWDMPLPLLLDLGERDWGTTNDTGLRHRETPELPANHAADERQHTADL